MPVDILADTDTRTRLALLGRALSNPLRVRIAVALMDRDEASPSELAKDLDESLGNLSYHVRYLYDLGFLELSRMVPRRGALEHFYRLQPPLRAMLTALGHWH